MRRRPSRAAAALAGATALLCALATAPAQAAVSTDPAAPRPTAPRSLTPAATLPGTGCPALPATSVWHADVSRLPVHTRSAQWLSHMQASTRRLHADFGPAYGAQPVPYGIPVTVVNGAPRVSVQFDYADESDSTTYPLSTATKIEGGWDAGGDRHAIVVDAATCRLYETWDTRLSGGRWYAGSGATWLLTSNALRPAGWTSADAAGLAILPGLLRYDEVARGEVDHAIRFTTNATDRRYLWPARHQAGSVTDASYPPMGAWFRLKASYDISGYSRDAQVVLRAMKKHGLVLADNGSPWYLQGTSDTRWGSDIVSQLGRVPASAFEAVDTARLMVSSSSGEARRL